MHWDACTGVGTVSSQKLLVADMLSGRYMTVKLRGKQAGCKACGPQPRITSATLPDFDYAAFTGQQYDDKCGDLSTPRTTLMPAAFFCN